jgi:uncharacterized protein (TIGR00297 family)
MNFGHIFQIPPWSDWVNLVILFLLLLAIIVFSEIIRKYRHWPQEVTRKIVHISVGFLLFLSPVLLQTSLPLLCIALFFTIFNFIAIKRNLLPGIHIDRRNFGTAYYALSFFLLVLIFWDGYKVVIIASMMVMAVGDAAAAIVGRSIKNARLYTLIHDKKSLEGSLTMFLVSSLCVFITLKFYPHWMAAEKLSVSLFIMISISIAMIATAAEALGNHGNDNLSVPLLSGVFLYFFLQTDFIGINQVIIALLLGLMAALSSWRFKFLTQSGAVSAFILASILFGFGGWKWTLPILCFFVFSSILSKIGKKAHENIFEKGSQRDHSQVLANGGIPALFMIIEILIPHPASYVAYLGALAAATADTWATEIGMRIGQMPRLITTLKTVPAGTSGGITLGGSMGALLGALILALSGIYFTGAMNNQVGYMLALITTSGFIASFIDSLLGATLQAQFQCSVCGKITEKKNHCGQTSFDKVYGLKWMNNDVVNFFNTLAGAAIAIILYQLIT